MKRLKLLLCAAALVLSACSSDDHHDRKPPEAPWHPATAMLEKYVTNADGSLTRAQMEAGLHRDFDAADKDHSGCLNADETMAINQQRFAEDQSTASPLVDLTGRGCIDFSAYATTARSLFDTLDRDNNGVLTAQELHPWQPAGKEGEPGGPQDHRGRRQPGGPGSGGGPDGN